MKTSRPWRSLAHNLEDRLRCLFGFHEFVTVTTDPTPATGATPARGGVLRLRCLNCRIETPGWEQGPPGYRRTQAPKPAALALPNARLAALDAREHAAEPVAATGGRRQNVTKFPLAKSRRLR